MRGGYAKVTRHESNTNADERTRNEGNGSGRDEFHGWAHENLTSELRNRKAPFEASSRRPQPRFAESGET
jgi:hypothetical protein